MAGKAGTTKGCSIDGIDYDVIFDTNATRVGAKFENTTIPTTGKPMLQQTKRNEDIESIKLACDTDQYAALKSIADNGDEVSLSLTYADNKTYNADGWINLDNHESETNTTNVKMMPTTDWAVF